MEPSACMKKINPIWQKFATAFCITFILILSESTSAANDKPSSAQAVKTYTIALTEIPGFLSTRKTEPGTLINNEILTRIEKRHNILFKSEFYPVKRATVNFNKGYFDLVFAMSLGDIGSDLTISQTPNSIDSAPIAGSGYAVFTRKDTKKVNSLAQLNGKNIGVLAGITPPNSFDERSVNSITQSQSIEQSFKMLRKGRIDAVLTIKAVGLDEIKRLDIADIEYGDEFDYIFACYSAHLTPIGAKLIEFINQALGEIIKDGTYKKLVNGYPGSLLQN